MSNFMLLLVVLVCVLSLSLQAHAFEAKVDQIKKEIASLSETYNSLKAEEKHEEAETLRSHLNDLVSKNFPMFTILIFLYLCYIFMTLFIFYLLNPIEFHASQF